MKRFRVFCPYCKDTFSVEESSSSIRPIIDRPCRKCGKAGVDAVES
jgi:endogenous inhibitor of DNA gyrase (YacG/DUF329 family)